MTTTEGDATTGKNVLIDADSVDIRDGTTTLATFSASEISLKSDSEKNKVKMGGFEIWTQKTDAGTTGYLYAKDNIALVAGLSSGSGLRGLRLSAVGEVGISTNTDSVNISAESGEVALTGNLSRLMPKRF